MSLIAVEAALEARLQEMVDLPPTAWEDKGFKPTTGVTHLRVHHLRNTPRSLYVDGPESRLMGIFQVSVFVPSGRGKVEAIALAEKVARLFEPVQSIDGGNHRIDLDDPANIASGMQTEDGWYMVPVSVNWMAFPT